MKSFVTLLITMVCSVNMTVAQTFVDQIQQKNSSKATVTVTQSKEITNLVNGKKVANPAAVNPTTVPSNNTALPKTEANEPINTNVPTLPTTIQKMVTEPNKAEATTKTDAQNNNEMNIPTIDLRKKVMRKSYKVQGYRVQVFAGGNSRADRQKAEKIREHIKQEIPNEPIYVHFYSPRWICRIGNYRSYEEASQILQAIKQLGYKQASIVHGNITVQY